jgi:hypothetical protein
MATCWIAAEHALHHVEKNFSQIEMVFLSHNIEKSQYSIYAGFDESLIRAGVGYLEQIHLFTTANVAPQSPLLSQLGKILSPFSSILFTASNTLRPPVYKTDGVTTWGFDELTFEMASKIIDRGSTAAMHPTVISLSRTTNEATTSGFRSTASGPGNEYDSDDSDSGTVKERKEGGGGGEVGGGSEETDEHEGEDQQGHGNGDGFSDDHVDMGSGGDPGFPGKPFGKRESIRSSTIDFEVVSDMKFPPQSGKMFQYITTEGTLTIQVYIGSVIGFHGFVHGFLDGQETPVHNMPSSVHKTQIWQHPRNRGYWFQTGPSSGYD